MTTENKDPKKARTIELVVRDGRLKLHADIPAGDDGRVQIFAEMSAETFSAAIGNMGAAVTQLAPAFLAQIRPVPCGDCDQPEDGEEEREDPSPDCDPPPPPPGVSYPPPPPQVVR